MIGVMGAGFVASMVTMVTALATGLWIDMIRGTL